MWDVLESADRDLLLRCLRIFNVHPQEALTELSPELAESIGAKALRALRDWYDGREFVDSNLPLLALGDRLAEKIKVAVRAKSLDRIEHERAAVRLVANKLAVLHDLAMTSAEIEDAIFAKVSADQVPILRLLLMAGRYTALASRADANAARLGTDTLRTLLTDATIREVDRTPLRQILERSVEYEEVEVLGVLLELTENARLAILGVVWVIANIDGIANAAQRQFYDALAHTFGVAKATSLIMRERVEKNLHDARKHLAEAAGEQNLSSVGFTDLTDAAASAAGSMVVLGLAEMAGFGLFMGAVVALKAFGLLMGVSFAFGTYTTLTWVLGVVTGPVGWVGVPLVVGGSVLVYRWLSAPYPKQLLDLVVVVASARERGRLT